MSLRPPDEVWADAQGASPALLLRLILEVLVDIREMVLTMDVYPPVASDAGASETETPNGL